MRTSSFVALASALMFVASCGTEDHGGDEAAEHAGAAHQTGDGDVTVAGGGTLVEGWNARPDRGSLENLNFRMEDGALRVTVGPAVILYRDDQGTGDYTAEATFTQLSSLGHAHGYGLIIGGHDLQDEGQRYTYFLVRGDGTYLIKRRVGAELTELTDGFVPSDAVVVSTADDGQASNTLAVRVEGAMVHFLMNGTEVLAMPASEIETNGLVGLRINHNLDVAVRDFAVTTG